MILSVRLSVYSKPVRTTCRLSLTTQFDRQKTTTRRLPTAQSLMRLLGAYSATSAHQPGSRPNRTVCKCERLMMRSHGTQIEQSMCGGDATLFKIAVFSNNLS